MATRIIDMDLPTLPLTGSELVEVSEGGTKSVKVAINELLTKLYADTTAVISATLTGLQSEIDILIFRDKNGNDALIIENGGAGLLKDNVLRLVTDATGVTIIGTLTVNDLKVDGNSIILGSTYLTEVIGGGLKIEGNLEVTGTASGIDPVASTDFVPLGYMTRLGTDRQRLFYPVVGTDATDNLEISIERLIDLKHVDFDIVHTQPPWQEGRVFWDRDNNTFGVYNDVPAVTLQVGQETHIKIRNESGVLIPDGTVCYISGASGSRALVLPAIATSPSTSEGIVMATHDISNNTDGYGTIIGRVGSQNTTAFAEGAELWLSPFVAGAVTDVKPSAPNYVVDIGNVIVSDSTEGSILVHILNHGDFETLSDVNIPVPPTNGQTLVYDEDTQAWSPEAQIKVISYTIPLSGVTDVQVPLTGSFITKGSGETGDVAGDFAVSNQHVWVLINSVTLVDSTGSIIISGASLDESTGLPTVGDTEIIITDSTAGTYYQTTNKWWEVTNIAISGDIVAIDFDYGVIGYPDLGNRNFKIVGYRMDAFSSGVSPDMRLIISKVHDLGNQKIEIFNLEDIGVDSGDGGDQIIDHVRTGGDDRSFNPAVTDIWANNETLTFKQLDFDDYWSDNENHILGAEGDSGFLIRIEGEPDGGGISNVDYITLLLYYTLL